MNKILSVKPRYPHEVAKEIASRVKQRRLELGLTQRALARRADLALSTYRLFEQKGNISLKSLLNIAFALNTLDDFDNIFDKRQYTSIDELISGPQKTRKRGKENE